VKSHGSADAFDRARHRAGLDEVAMKCCTADAAVRQASGGIRDGGNVIWSRIVGTGSYLPPKVVHQRGSWQANGHHRRMDPGRAPASASVTRRPSQASSRSGCRGEPRGACRRAIIPQEIISSLRPGDTRHIFPSTACIMQASWE